MFLYWEDKATKLFLSRSSGLLTAIFKAVFSARIEGEVVAGKLAVESGANVDASISMKGAKKMKALSSTEKTHSEKTA